MELDGDASIFGVGYLIRRRCIDHDTDPRRPVARACGTDRADAIAVRAVLQVRGGVARLDHDGARLVADRTWFASLLDLVRRGAIDRLPGDVKRAGVGGPPDHRVGRVG